ncbi:hypothetical protein KKA14_21355 [bacterium]|nr:hypothetical protein [bacterium]
MANTNDCPIPVVNRHMKRMKYDKRRFGGFRILASAIDYIGGWQEFSAGFLESILKKERLIIPLSGLVCQKGRLTQAGQSREKLALAVILANAGISENK